MGVKMGGGEALRVQRDEARLTEQAGAAGVDRARRKRARGGERGQAKARARGGRGAVSKGETPGAGVGSRSG